MLVSIGKSSLARAAAVAVTPSAKAAEPVSLATGLQSVAVEAISPAAGDKWPARVSAELVSSVEAHGVLEPVLLAQTAPGQLVLIAGARRLAAAKKAGLATVPAVIQSQTAADAAALRKEIKAFAAAPKAEKATLPVTAGATAVGEAMPDWLL